MTAPGSPLCPRLPRLRLQAAQPPGNVPGMRRECAGSLPRDVPGHLLRQQQSSSQAAAAPEEERGARGPTRAPCPRKAEFETDFVSRRETKAPARRAELPAPGAGELSVPCSQPWARARLGTASAGPLRFSALTSQIPAAFISASSECFLCGL